MADRVNMRSLVTSEFAWEEPFGDTPDWRVWRNAATNNADAETGDTSENICRSIKGFVGLNKFKP